MNLPDQSLLPTPVGRFLCRQAYAGQAGPAFAADIGGPARLSLIR